MTGKSDASSSCIRYYKKLIGGFFILGGGFLLLEHLFVFGGFDLEILGHEWYGFVLIIIGILLNLKREQIPGLKKAIKNCNFRAILDEGER